MVVTPFIEHFKIDYLFCCSYFQKVKKFHDSMASQKPSVHNISISRQLCYFSMLSWKNAQDTGILYHKLLWTLLPKQEQMPVESDMTIPNYFLTASEEINLNPTDLTTLARNYPAVRQLIDTSSPFQSSMSYCNMQWMSWSCSTQKWLSARKTHLNLDDKFALHGFQPPVHYHAT